jgi:phosphonopyruvate decarboxylase
MKHNDGPGLLEIRVRPGARKDLGRPTTTPIQNKDAFMEFLKA